MGIFVVASSQTMDDSNALGGTTRGKPRRQWLYTADATLTGVQTQWSLLTSTCLLLSSFRSLAAAADVPPFPAALLTTREQVSDEIFRGGASMKNKK